MQIEKCFVKYNYLLGGIIRMKVSHSFNKDKVKAILIDSGRVLNVPVSGHWFITPNFFCHVNKKKFNSLKASQKELALSKGAEYINKQTLILNEAEEYKHFIKYYKIFSSCLPDLQLTEKDIQALAKDLVYNYNKYVFFKDVFTLIPELSKSYKLAVVSDAWPSLENVFKEANLREYFSSFIISSVKGVTKPNELMYRTALDELGVTPDEAIFVDDSIKNCDGAIKLGLTSFVLCRDWKLYTYNKFKNRNYNIIKNLNDLNKLLV